MQKVKTAVLVSGGGTNLQAILDAERSGKITNATIAAVISDRAEAYALRRAEQAGVEAVTIPFKELGRSEFERQLILALQERGIELIVLAGFMRILSADFTSRYPERILNIHPSLIPSFCGEGYYGLKVHRAALDYGVKVTGATVHFVNEVPDGGKIVAQKAVYIHSDDTPESLQKRVMREAEWIIFPEAIESVAGNIRRSK
ncbi:MAG TPA: phosphoribosylglycinamide formyltransferase [Candidatus Stercoripulliclostridium merdigallinarum]|uniref:Phosphoribosylglycinamide formyltransferase n=1 Tax=Candidatus Stercoripulliclostridium merdigallinarum TaxID=2840951 RepID=A0A9D1SHV7_9FIRM|nr:phosphoribosylglycinamide formyltransferase [Candidatus Stercoripulliclostridium merdigallinarum]